MGNSSVANSFQIPDQMTNFFGAKFGNSDFSFPNASGKLEDMNLNDILKKEMQSKNILEFSYQEKALAKNELYSTLKKLVNENLTGSNQKFKEKDLNNASKILMKDNFKQEIPKKEFDVKKLFFGENDIEKFKNLKIYEKSGIPENTIPLEKIEKNHISNNLEEIQSNLSFFENLKNEKIFKSAYFKKEDFGLAIKISDAFLKIMEKKTILEFITNLSEFNNIKAILEDEFDYDPFLSSILKSFLNIIKLNMHSIFYKSSTQNTSNDRNEREVSHLYSPINYQNLVYSLTEFEIFKHISNKRISDYAYFRTSLSSRCEDIQNVFDEVIDQSMENPDFFILNDNFLKSIKKTDYQRAAHYKEKIKFYFLKEKNKEYCFNKENIEYEEKCFEKNLKFFDKIFDEQFLADYNFNCKNKHQNLTIDNFNPHQKFRFYLVKAISYYFLNLSKILNRDDYLLDLSHAYLTLNSKAFEDFSLKLLEEESKIKSSLNTNYLDLLIKVRDRVFMNSETLGKFKDFFYKLFEENIFSNPNGVFRDVNKSNKFYDGDIDEENLKDIVKVHAYYLAFGKQKDCVDFLLQKVKKLEENEESVKSKESTVSLFKSMLTEVKENLRLKEEILNQLEFQKETDNNNNNDQNHNNSNLPLNNNNNNNGDNNNNTNNNRNNNNNNPNNNDNIQHEPNRLDPLVNISMQIIREDPRINHKVLSIDGGGIKGIFALFMLRELEFSLGVPIYDLFDFFTGTSIGGLISLGFAFKVYRAETLFREMVSFFKDTVFINSSFFRKCNKVSALVFSSTIYCESTLENILQKRLVNILNVNNNREILKLSHESKNFLITACKQDKQFNKLIPYCFTKYNGVCELNRISFSRDRNSFEFHPESLGALNISNVAAWEVARATSAAYPFFKAKKIGNLSLVDGGFLFNNPSLLALEYIRKKALRPNASEINLSKFYKSVFMLSIGLEDKQTINSNEFQWSNERDRVENYMHIPAHASIAGESPILYFPIFGYEKKIEEAMNKLVNFSKDQTREKLGNGFVRIEPDFLGGKHDLDAVSFAEIQRLLAYSEQTLSRLERNQCEGDASLCRILMNDYKAMMDEFHRGENLMMHQQEINNQNINNNHNRNNPNRNYINTISLSNLRNFFFSLGITNNTLTDLTRFAMNATRINPNSCSRVVTRYQKYPLCYSEISRLLKEMQNPNLTQEHLVNIDSKLFKTLENFDFKKSQNQFYQNISSEESKIELPYFLFKSGIKGITYAMAIGHLGLIEYYKQKDYMQLRQVEDYYLWSSYHTAIANDELISFIAIVRDFFPVNFRAYVNNSNTDYDKNDISIESFIEEDELVSNEVIRKLNDFRDDLERKQCKYWFDLFGISTKNAKEFMEKYKSHKIKEFKENLNTVLRRNQLDNLII